MYEVRHPLTGEPIPTPKFGWRVSRDVMAEMDAAGQVLWGKDHTTNINRKLILTDDSEGVPAPTFTADRDSATKHLVNLLGNERFKNPKPYEVLMRWFRIVAPKDAVVLDFFGGSGSTMEAVTRLNDEDGDVGRRSCILVTNNSADIGKRFVPDGGERGICQHVTAPRIKAVLQTGFGSTKPILQRCEWFRLDYLHGRQLKQCDADATAAILPTLWVDAGMSGRLGKRQADGVYVHPDGAFAALPAVVPAGDFLACLGDVVPRTVWVIGESGSKPDVLRTALPGVQVRFQTGSYKEIIDNAVRESS